MPNVASMTRDGSITYLKTERSALREDGCCILLSLTGLIILREGVTGNGCKQRFHFLQRKGIFGTPYPWESQVFKNPCPKNLSGTTLPV